VVDSIKSDLAELRQQLEGGADITAIRESYSRLEGAAFKIAESMYADDAT
jgi:molecular chaperone DnaK